MKTNNLYKQILNVLAAASLASATLMAQSSPGAVLHVTVPFGFTAGTRILPGGEYVVQPNLRGSIITIRDEKDRKAVMLLSHSGEPAVQNEKAQLTFWRYGNRYFLHRVTTFVGENSADLYVTAAERESASAAIHPVSIGIVAHR